MLIQLSSKTEFHQAFKMSALCKMLGASKDVRTDGRVITAVELCNVLNNETLNLQQSGAVKEIYIFKLTLAEKRIPSLFITALDKFTNFHTVFVLECDDEQILYGALKERTDKGFKIGKYYSTEWTSTPTPVTLPVDIATLDEAYTALIDALIPLTTRPNETTADFVARYEQIVKLNKEISKLQRQVDTERQPKRRFDLNDKLKELKKELEKYARQSN